jgi:Ferroportin1 (FPN1)
VSCRQSKQPTVAPSSPRPKHELLNSQLPFSAQSPPSDQPTPSATSAHSPWSAYMHSPVALAAVALALLYLTVLSFGLLMTAYLKWRGMSEAELSIYRGLGAIAGLSATVAFPSLRRKAGAILLHCYLSNVEAGSLSSKELCWMPRNRVTVVRWEHYTNWFLLPLPFSALQCRGLWQQACIKCPSKLRQSIGWMF